MPLLGAVQEKLNDARALREALIARLRKACIAGEVVDAEVRSILRRIGQTQRPRPPFAARCTLGLVG